MNINQEQIYSQHFIPFPDGLYTAAGSNFLHGFFSMQTTGGNCRHRGENSLNAGDTHI